MPLSRRIEQSGSAWLGPQCGQHCGQHDALSCMRAIHQIKDPNQPHFDTLPRLPKTRLAPPSVHPDQGHFFGN